MPQPQMLYVSNDQEEGDGCEFDAEHVRLERPFSER
jgi:hypothetical protein